MRTSPRSQLARQIRAPYAPSLAMQLDWDEFLPQLNDYSVRPKQAIDQQVELALESL